MHRTWRAVGLVLLATALAGCSGSSAAEQRASICPDLSNLAATMRVAFSPPSDATVGDVRSALGKLESTWGHIGQANVIPADQRTEISQARLDYLKAIANVGDDDPASSVRTRTAGLASRLASDTAAVWRALGCPGRPPGP
ncbi:MAG: hypothetical protein ACM3OO_08985 [Planctomycetaceae bacterium]